MMSSFNLTFSAGEEPKLIFNFVVQNGEMSDAMKLAFEAAKEYLTIEFIKTLTESECLNIPKAELKEKKQIFIFDKFSGPAFEYIEAIPGCWILGNRCLLTMLIENVPLPTGLQHVHNLSMHGLIICLSKMDLEEKKKIKKLVGYMGGIHLDNLTDIVTHLVTKSVISLKYEEAGRNGLNIMHPDWVHRVWSKTQDISFNKHANDEQFESFKLPIFFDLNVSSTGLKLAVKNKVKMMIEENGGKYHSSFKPNYIQILLLESDSTASEKYKSAIRNKKPCVKPQWVLDSIKEGYALSVNAYLVKVIRASTPTKESNVTVSKFNPDSTQLSEISSDLTLRSTTISETIASRVSELPVASPSLQMSTRSSLTNEHKGIVSKITLQLAKKAGIIFDGCNFYLSGFSMEESNQLKKVILACGGNTIGAVSDQITHVIVGIDDPSLETELRSNEVHPTILKLNWLHESIEKRKMLNEIDYAICKITKAQVHQEPPSPASKKAIQSMNNIFKKPNIPHFSLDPKLTLEQNEEKKDDIELLSQYLKPNAQSTMVPELIKAPEQISVRQIYDIETADDTEDDTILEPIFTGKYIHFYGFKDAADTLQIMQDCEKMRGTMVDDSYTKEVDYVITQTTLSECKPRIKKYRNLVNELWILQCMSEQKLLDVEYYHKPLIELQPEEKRPLAGETIVVTNYKQQEREFISMMVTVLGGDYTEVLNMKHKPILISPNAEGRKAESALKWGFTVLSVGWLRECLEQKNRADETPYLIGGCKPSSNNIVAPDSIVPSSQEIDFHTCHGNASNPRTDDQENKDSDDEFLSNRPIETPILSNKRIQLLKKSSKSASPETPQTPNGDSDYSYHDVDDLVAAMPTPQRQHTMAVLAEMKDKNMITPRSKRLQAIVDTPDIKSLMEPMSPMPDLPECMKPPPVNYALRPDASPETQWFHKRKIDVLDEFYNPMPKEKRMKTKPVTPPSYRRYDFLKARLPGYNSPDPRMNTQDILNGSRQTKNESSDELASKLLNFDDETSEDPRLKKKASDNDETLQGLQDMLKRKSAAKAENEKKQVEELMERRKNLEQCEIIAASSSLSPRKKSSLITHQDSEMLVGYGEPIRTARVSLDRVTSMNFAITNLFKDQISNELIDKIKKLGAKIDPKKAATHVVVAAPNRGERFLSAVASGMYVVHHNFVLDSYKNGKFLPEDEYEFGNARFKISLIASQTFSSNDPIFTCPYRWRIKIQNEPQRYSNGAFTGCTFIILANKDKINGIKNVLKAGGAKVVEMEPPFSSVSLRRSNVTHCLAHQKNLTIQDVDFLRNCDIACYQIIFVNEFLISCGEGDFTKFSYSLQKPLSQKQNKD